MKHYSFNEIFLPSLNPEEIYIGYKTSDIFYSQPIHDHEFFEMTYLTSGAEFQIINGKKHYLKKGDIIVLSPNDSHEHSAITNINPFNCSFMNHAHLSFFPQLSAFPIVIHLDEQSQIAIEQICYMLNEEFHGKLPYRELALWHYLDSIFLIIQRNMQNSKLKKWEKVLEYVLNNPKEADFNTAVSLFGYSSGHFCRMFKKDFSMTFTQFLINVRIQNAKKILANSSENIKQVYERCGYNSNQRFFYDFKKITGITPMQYRNQLKSTSHIPPQKI